MESAQAKNQALMEAGAIVPTSFEALESAIKETFEKLVSSLVFFVSWYCLLLQSYVFISIPPKRLKKERSLLSRKSFLHKSPRISIPQLRAGKFGLLLT